MTPRALKRLCALENLASAENLLIASKRAMKGKRYRPDVQAWAMREEAEVLAMRDELLSGAWQPGPYHFFEIRDPKRRTIAAAPVPRPPCRGSGNLHAKPFCGARGTRAIHLTRAPVPWAVATQQGQDAAGGVAGRCPQGIKGRPAHGIKWAQSFDEEANS